LPGPDGNTGVVSYNGGASTITFTGLEPFEDLAPAPVFVLTDAAALDVLNIVDGPVSTGLDPITGFPEDTYQVNFSGGAEEFNFRNKDLLIVEGLGGNDTVSMSVLGPGTSDSLAEIRILGVDGEDTVNVDATPGTLAVGVSVFGGGGDDEINVGSASADVSAILDAFIVDGGGDPGDELLIDDSVGSTDPLITVTDAGVAGIAPGLIS
jgi:hypothetical protein